MTPSPTSKEFCRSKIFAFFKGAGFNVYCALDEGHKGRHESADFWWNDGDNHATVKGS
jgi:hypothetical protein